MATRRRKTTIPGPVLPNPEQQMRWSAESMAENAMRNHPMVKKIRNHITDEVMRATKKAIGTKMGTQHDRRHNGP